MKYSALLISIILFCLSLLQPELTEAFTMSDLNYILQMGNLNTAAGLSTGTGKRLNITVGQTAPGLFTGTNYTLRSGFQYISSIIYFKFTIDNISINFGTLLPSNSGTFYTRTNTLTVSNGSGYGFVVTAQENHSLQDSATNASIPDTTCDSGTPCTESTSGNWTSPLTYGFGYRCDALNSNTNCGSGFTTSTYFKQFANLSNNKTAQTVMSNGAKASRSYQTKITYQINISNTQAAGTYSNLVTYIATPTF